MVVFTGIGYAQKKLQTSQAMLDYLGIANKYAYNQNMTQNIYELFLSTEFFTGIGSFSLGISQKISKLRLEVVNKPYFLSSYKDKIDESSGLTVNLGYHYYF